MFHKKLLRLGERDKLSVERLLQFSAEVSSLQKISFDICRKAARSEADVVAFRRILVVQVGRETFIEVRAGND